MCIVYVYFGFFILPVWQRVCMIEGQCTVEILSAPCAIILAVLNN